MNRKFLSILLCVCMMITTIPFSAFAEETQSDISEVTSSITETSLPAAQEPASEAISETIPEPVPESDNTTSEEISSAASTPEPPTPEASAESTEQDQEAASTPEVQPEEPENSAPPETSYVPGFTVAESQQGGTYAWPVPGYTTISQGYDAEKHPALDIAADAGADVLALADGTITEIQLWDGSTTDETSMQSYGNMVTIKHNDGNTSKYAHLSQIAVQEGQTVEKGKIIGKIGSTGNSTGNHLHLELITTGGKVNPLPYITSTGDRSARAVTYTIVVDTSKNLNDVVFTLSNGARESGWFSKYVAETGLVAYCVQQGWPLNTGNNGGFTSGELATDFAKRASLADYFGRITRSGNALKNEFMVQLYIWELQGITVVSLTSDYGGSPDVTMTDYNSFKSEIQPKINAFFSKPSFNGQTVTLRPGENITLTDTNASFTSYEASAILNNTGTTLVKTGNSLTITASGTSHSGTIQYRYNVASSFRVPTLYFQSATLQDCITTGIGDPASITLNIRILQNGDLKLVKTSEDGIISGMQFSITGNALPLTRITGADGTINVADMPVYDSNNVKIQYTATEINTPGRYAQPASQTFTLTENATTTITFANTLKKGDLQLVKTSEDGIVAGMTFDFSGNGQTWTDTTGVGGTISTAGLAVYDSNNQLIQYTATEVGTPGRYVQPASKTFTLTENATTAINFINVLKKWQLTVTKQDGETTTAQGDATLAGAIYGIYKGGVLQDTYTTDSNGKFVTKVYYCDTDFTLQEITPSPGYQLDTTVYAVGMHPGSTTIEMNSISKTVMESVIKGKVQIHKFLEKYNSAQHSGQRDPEPDAVFELYLTSAGSYAAARTDQKDLLTTDADGIALSKDLPYGWYTAHQIAGNPSYSFADDFQVHITEQGKTYVYYIGNAGIYAQVKIIKKDAETGEIVAFAGTGFKVKDLATGEFVKQTLTYPSNTVISEFYTNAEGWLVLPEPLLKGNYELHEIVAPDGYVLASNPIPFTVDGSAEIVEVVMKNRLIRGSVELTKADAEDIAVLLSGAEFEVYQEQNGQKVIVGNLDEVTPGVYQLDLLTTGKYFLREAKAPEGYLLDEEIYPFEIVEDGVTITIKNEPNVGFIDWQIPEIHTTAAADGEKEVPTDKVLTIVDTVAYQHLKPGEAYTVTGKLMDKLTEEPFLVEGKEVTSQVTFTPDTPSGSIEVEFTFDAIGVTIETDVVVFESLYHKSVELITHADIADEGQTVRLVPLKGTVTTTKVNAEDPTDKLSGAVFDVFQDTDGDGKYTEGTDTLQGSLTETEFGVYQLTELPYGKYLLNERTAPDGFVRDPIYYSFEITEDGQVVKFDTIPGKDFPNKPIKGTVTTTKVDADNPNLTLSGAEFVIYKDTDGDGKYTENVDVLYGTLTKGDKGVYSFENLPYGKYLIHEQKAPDGYIRDNNYYGFEITEDGQTVKFETIPGKDFPNTRQPGTPKTGDISNLFILILITTAGLVGIFSLTIVWLRKRRIIKIKK